MPLQLNSIILLRMVIIRIDNTTYTDDKLFNPSNPNLGRREKLKLIFFFTFLCGATKGFMKAFVHKNFRGTTKKCENKSLTLFVFQYNFQICTGREV